MRPSYPPEVQGLARALRRSGLSPKPIAARLGIPYSTVYRWLNPAYQERGLAASREAKRRRTGVCEACGAVTRYNGWRGNNGPSRFCRPCQAASTRKTQCGRGHPLSGDNLYVSPCGERRCRECQRGYQRAHRERRRRAA